MVSCVKNLNVKRSMIFYATNVLYEQFLKIFKCFIATPSLNKQQGSSEISKISVS